MSFDHNTWVWMNGRMVRWRDATVHVSVHALHYGTGVFEGIRCYPTESGPAIFRLSAHLDRLFASAAMHGLDIPYTHVDLESAILELISRNGFQSCYVRPICFLGSHTLGLDPGGCPVETAILAWPWRPLLGDDALDRGVRVTVSPWLKFHSTMMPTTAKACRQYLNSVLAARDAHTRGFDEALLVGADGFLSEGSSENIFLVRNGRLVLVTNDERHSILMGVTRDTVIRIASDLGVPTDVSAFGPDDVHSADEAFLTGTAAEIVPIRESDGRPVGAGTRGPLTALIQRAFFAATSGLDARYRDWLEIVPSGKSGRLDALAPPALPRQ